MNRGMAYPTIIAVLSLCAVCVTAVAQTAGQTTSKTDPSLPQITVNAKIFEKKVRTFISKISGIPYWSDDDPVALWRAPICPLVAGLPREDGELVFNRLTFALDSVGVPLASAGCRPNFFIVVTPQPEATLKEWSRHDTRMYGDAIGSENFIHTPRPVRIWYNATYADSDGTDPMPFGSLFGGFDGLPTFKHNGLGIHQEFVVVPHLESVIAVIDYSRVMGLDWRQVTDYVAMAGLTKVDLDSDYGGTSTILRLFSSAGDDRPQGLSEWDKAFLRELYSTSTMSRHQRRQVATRMLHDVAP